MTIFRLKSDFRLLQAESALPDSKAAEAMGVAIAAAESLLKSIAGCTPSGTSEQPPKCYGEQTYIAENDASIVHTTSRVHTSPAFVFAVANECSVKAAVSDGLFAVPVLSCCPEHVSLSSSSCSQ